jgi:hypothetical protein
MHHFSLSLSFLASMKERKVKFYTIKIKDSTTHTLTLFKICA